MKLALDRVAIWVTIFVSLLSCRLSAQWVDETYSLKGGWNAIWLSHDTSWASIDDLLAAHPNIMEVWQWNTFSSTSTFTDNPVAVVGSDTQWFVWKRGFPTESTMAQLSANSACLVRVLDGAPSFNLTLKGRPVAPNYLWASNGTNLLGFPMKPQEDIFTRNFSSLLALNQDFTTEPEVFKYDGGALDQNPKRVVAPLFEPVVRGRAYWINSDTYSEFYGPLRVSASSEGLAYGESGTVHSLRIRNVTAESVTATMSLVSSAAAPLGQEPVAGGVVLNIRGAFDPTSGGFSFESFGNEKELILAAGEEVEVVFAVDRAATGGGDGDVFQSILRISDSLEMAQIDLPVSARSSSLSGLWVGTVELQGVDQITATPAPQGDGTATVNVSKLQNARVPKSFKMRVIMHRDDSGSVRLLQKVFLGKNDANELILTTSESSLDADQISSARRVSSASFALDTVIVGLSDIPANGVVEFRDVLPYTASTNPFVHTYHPDHDNRDAQYSILPLAEGEESYTLARTMQFGFVTDPSVIGISSGLGWGSTFIGGQYRETISGLRAQPISIYGVFVLQKLNAINTLTP